MPYSIDANGTARPTPASDLGVSLAPHRHRRPYLHTLRAVLAFLGSMFRRQSIPVRKAWTWLAVGFIALIGAAMICGFGLAVAEKISEPNPPCASR